jgi:hypothetical protein
MVYIHGGFLVFGSNGAEPQASRRQVNWMSARPSGQLASGEFRLHATLEQVDSGEAVAGTRLGGRRTGAH